MNPNSKSEILLKTTQRTTNRAHLISSSIIVTQIIAIIAAVEFCIMLAFYYFEVKFESHVLEAFTNAFILSFLSSPLLYIWVIRPFVKAREVAEKNALQLALYDPLTHLPNRRFLEGRLQHVINMCKRGRSVGAMLLLDLDHFKPINDQHGHQAGDLVLREIAVRLKALVRETDLAARLGGDEFVVLMSDCSDDRDKMSASATILARKIRNSITAPILFSTIELKISVSIGIRLIHYDPDNTSEDSQFILQDADKAMYQAKKSGRGKVILFS